MQGTNFKLKPLSHDQIPVSFFVLKETLLTNLASSLKRVISLCLTLDTTSSLHTRVWKNLGEFLLGTPNLKYLRFRVCSL
jgi:hypothetical protein